MCNAAIVWKPDIKHTNETATFSKSILCEHLMKSKGKSFGQFQILYLQEESLNTE